MNIFLADLFTEAYAVGIVCGVFLLLFIVAGIKQIIDDKSED